MTEKMAFSVCSLDVDRHQELGSFMHRVLEVESSVWRVLNTLTLQSEVEMRPQCDFSKNKFGMAVWLKESKQRNLLKQLDPTLPSNYVDAEVSLVLERFQSLLTQVSRQFSGDAASSFIAEDVGGRTLTVGDLMRVCKKLAADGDTAEIRDACGTAWSAQVQSRSPRLASNEVQELVALPIKVGNDRADFRLAHPRDLSLPLRGSIVEGNWIPLVDPGFHDRLCAAMRKNQWLWVTCNVALHPSGYLKQLEIVGLQDYDVFAGGK